MPVMTRSKKSAATTEMLDVARILLSMRNATSTAEPQPVTKRCLRERKAAAVPEPQRPRRTCANYEPGAFADMDDDNAE